MYTPGDVQQLVGGLQGRLAGSWPQVRELMQLPGAADMAADVSRAVAQRFAARVIKFAFGVSEVRVLQPK
jgi:hypothetical protein